MQLNLLVLRCSDLELSRNFYERLGFIFKKERHDNGPIHLSSENDGFVFELYPLKNGEAIDNTRLGFCVENSSAVIAKLSVIEEYAFNGKLIHIVQDPDGRKIEVS